MIVKNAVDVTPIVPDVETMFIFVVPVETKSFLNSLSWYILKSNPASEGSERSNFKLLFLTTSIGGSINDNWWSDPPVDNMFTTFGGISLESCIVSDNFILLLSNL